MRYFIDLAYNGKEYHGWQKQPNVSSVQETVQKIMSTAFQFPIEITGAGRTDTGVHAKQLIAHFDCNKTLDVHQLTYKLNTMLPQSISVNNIYEVKPDAHARFDAISREYNYYVCTRKDPFLNDYSYYVKKQLDHHKMNQAAKHLLGHKDFKCFSKVKTDVNTYFCTIDYAQWEKKDHQLVFTIRADRFLRNMVRAIVGTLLEVGTGKINVEDIHRILESKDRCNAGKSVDAKGLFLTEIKYPNSIIKK